MVAKDNNSEDDERNQLRRMFTNDPSHDIEYLPAGVIIRGQEDIGNAYWNSFLPIFFDRMNHLMRKAMNEDVKEYDLTSAHTVYLIALDLLDGQTIMELSHFLDMDKANTNRVIKLLRERGYVYDDRKTPSSKKYSIFLTEKGKKLADIVMAKTQNQMNSYFEDFSLEEISTLRKMLVRILNRVDPDFQNYVDSPYIHPFYVYLRTHPPGEKSNPLRITSPDKIDEHSKQSSKKGEDRSNDPSAP